MTRDDAKLIRNFCVIFAVLLFCYFALGILLASMKSDPIIAFKAILAMLGGGIATFGAMFFNERSK